MTRSQGSAAGLEGHKHKHPERHYSHPEPEHEHHQPQYEHNTYGGNGYYQPEQEPYGPGPSTHGYGYYPPPSNGNVTSEQCFLLFVNAGHQAQLSLLL